MRSWKTLLAGIATVFSGVVGVVNDPLHAISATVLAQILAGIGLIFAKDSNVTGASNQPAPPPQQ